MIKTSQFKAGYVAIVGRPNVGKSTLLNRFLKFKFSGVSQKPQTTRHKILGVLHGEDYQICFLDTPGVVTGQSDVLSRRLASLVMDAQQEADLIILMVGPGYPGEIERYLINEMATLKKPCILLINKVDLVPKHLLLPKIQEYSDLYNFKEIIPISALRLDGIDRVRSIITEDLPVRDPIVGRETFTDRNERFFASEMILEKVFQRYWKEVPYFTCVEIESFIEASSEHGGKDYVSANIYVERVNQRGILIGKGGKALKEVGVEAREDIEELIGRSVHLELWVKVRPRWRKDHRFLQEIGY